MLKRTGLSMCACLLFPVSFAFAQLYTVTDLGVPKGSDSSTALGINDLGQVVGSAHAGRWPFRNHAFLWTRESGMQDLGTLGGVNSVAYGISNAGEIVGNSDVPGDAVNGGHAFLWTKDGGMQDLGTGGDPSYSSVALAINSREQIVGASSDPHFSFSHFILWTHGEDCGGADLRWCPEDLGTFGGDRAVPFGINDRGQIVGFYNRYPFGGLQAFIFSKKSGVRDLGTLAGGLTAAYGINNRGEVVGLSQSPLVDYSAFLWTAHGGMRDLGGSLFPEANALGINIRGEVVGVYTYPGGGTHAFLWTEDTGMQDLTYLVNTTGARLGGATAINARGQIVGYGVINGKAHALLLTPITH
jgi:probable HAF family extracellular repeat protein